MKSRRSGCDDRARQIEHERERENGQSVEEGPMNSRQNVSHHYCLVALLSFYLSNQTLSIMSYHVISSNPPAEVYSGMPPTRQPQLTALQLLTSRYPSSFSLLFISCSSTFSLPTLYFIQLSLSQHDHRPEAVNPLCAGSPRIPRSETV